MLYDEVRELRDRFNSGVCMNIIIDGKRAEVLYFEDNTCWVCLDSKEVVLDLDLISTDKFKEC